MIALGRALARLTGVALLLILGAAGLLAAVFAIQGGDGTLSLPHLASILGLETLRDTIAGWFAELEGDGPAALVAALCGIGAVLLGLLLLVGALLPGRERLLKIDTTPTGEIAARRRAVSAALGSLAERSGEMRSPRVRVRPHRGRKGGSASITFVGTRGEDPAPRAARAREDLAALERDLSLKVSRRRSRRRESRVR